MGFSVNVQREMRRPLEDRLLDKRKIATSGCWEWTGSAQGRPRRNLVLGQDGHTRRRRWTTMINRFTQADRDECMAAGHEWRWRKNGLRVVHNCIGCGARYVEEIDYKEER